jgi:hypothetical protein
MPLLYEACNGLQSPAERFFLTLRGEKVYTFASLQVQSRFGIKSITECPRKTFDSIYLAKDELVSSTPQGKSSQ